MASDPDDFDKNIENLKSTVRKSFSHLYASLKARELKTLRQLEAIRKQYQDNKDLERNCVQHIHISYDNESILLDNINKYGAIDFENLHFDSNIFTLEDYENPSNDHMYLYKDIEDLAKRHNEDVAIEEEALKQVTRNENCVCYVNIRTENVSKQFRDDNCVNTPLNDNVLVCNDSIESNEDIESIGEDKSNSSDVDMKKIDPTDEWLNSIKNQTETEPSQVSDGMEHSTFVCS